MLSVHPRCRALLSTTVLLLSVGRMASAQAGPDQIPVSSEEVTQTVEQIASRILESYVLEDAAKRLAVHLKSQLRAGAYTNIKDANALATLLTRELRAVSDDSHFEVVVRRDEPPATAPASEPEWLDPLRRRNFDFAKLEALPGNIGYLRLNSCPPPEVAGETATSAVAFLANSDAVIIDLRANGGGDGAMVQFLASYFFRDRTAISRVFHRAENQTITDYTLAYIPVSGWPTSSSCSSLAQGRIRQLKHLLSAFSS